MVSRKHSSDRLGPLSASPSADGRPGDISGGSEPVFGHEPIDPWHGLPVEQETGKRNLVLQSPDTLHIPQLFRLAEIECKKLEVLPAGLLQYEPSLSYSHISLASSKRRLRFRSQYLGSWRQPTMAWALPRTFAGSPGHPPPQLTVSPTSHRVW